MPKARRRRSQQPPPTPTGPAFVHPAWVVGGLLFLLAVLLYGFGPPNLSATAAGRPPTGLRTWGFDLLRYLPAGCDVVFWTAAVLLLVALATGGGRRILQRAAAAWGSCVAGEHDASWRRRLGDALLPLLLALVCWILQTRYALLGDNWLRLEQAVRGERLLYEWGTMVLAHAAIRAGDAVASLSPRASLAMLNTLAAVPFGCAAALLARRLGRSDASRGWVHLGLLGLGGVQLFCGYIEVYSWAFACATLYVACVVRTLDRGSLVLPIVTFVVSVALHAITLLFAPPLLGLLLLRLRRRRRSVHETDDPVPLQPESTCPAGQWPARSHVPQLAVVLLLLVAAILPLVAPALIYPHAAPPGSLSLLSPTLWWERINAFVLASPVGALLGLPLLAWAAVGLLRRRGVALPTEALVLLSAALPITLVLGEMKAVLGAADWDIFAFAGLPLLLWAVACLGDAKLPVRTLASPARQEAAPPTLRPSASTTRRSDRPAGPPALPPWLSTLRGIFPALVLLSLCNSWAFVAVNAGESSLQRIKDLVWTDPAPYFAGHPPPLHLAFLFESNGLREEMYAALMRGVQRYGDDPRMAYNLASAYFRDGDLAQAKRWAGEAIVTRPGYVPPIHMLFLIAEREGNATDALTAGELLLEIRARQPELVTPYLDEAELTRVRSAMARLRATP